MVESVEKFMMPLIRNAYVCLRVHFAVPRTWHYVVFCLWGLVGASKLAIQLEMIDSPYVYPFGLVVLVNGWFQRIPVSVFEICCIALLAFIFLWMVRSIKIILARKARGEKFANVFRNFLDVVSLLIAIDIWGGLATGVSAIHVRDQLNWHDSSTMTNDSHQITRLCQQLVQAATKIRALDFKSSDNFRNETLRLNDSIDTGLRQAATALGLPPQWKAKKTVPKPLITSSIWNGIGALGCYFPYTSEIVYDSNMDPVWFSYVIAHEKAHSMGILYEDEAMLMGYLACAYSGDPHAQYSAICHALVIFVFHLNRLDPIQAENVWRNVPREIRLDIVGRSLTEPNLDSDALELFESAWHQLIVLSGDGRGLESYDDVTLLCDFAASRSGVIFSESWSQGPQE